MDLLQQARAEIDAIDAEMAALSGACRLLPT